MVIKMFCVYDSKGRFFLPPFFQQTSEMAIRSFTEVANDAASPVGKFPEDYSLFEVGIFDDSNGVVEPLPAPINLGLAASYRVVMRDVVRNEEVSK